jgi:hypothetical protein
MGSTTGGDEDGMISAGGGGLIVDAVGARVGSGNANGAMEDPLYT